MPLSDRRILVVEDDYFFAMELKSCLQEAGALVDGPWPSTGPALARIDRRATPLDIAVLGIDLRDGETSYPVAEALDGLRVPYVFATARDHQQLQPSYTDRPLLRKPFTNGMLVSALLELMKTTGGRNMPNTDPDADSSVRPPRILVVEDDPLVRWAITEALRDLGVAVAEAATADEAWEYLNTGAEVDLVFTDYRMPGSMTGGQLAARVNEKHPNLQVIITSGYADRDEHATPIMTKPYELLTTAATLAHLAARNGRTHNDASEPKACSSPG